MPNMMMWMPYYYWNATFAWQKKIADLMTFTGTRSGQPKAALAVPEAIPLIAPANGDVDAKVQQRPVEPALVKLTKRPSRRKPSAPAKSKQHPKKGNAKLSGSRGRRASGARA